jgi:hypothetical protein
MKIKSKQLEENLGSQSSPFTSVHSSDFTGSLTGPIRFKAKNETGVAVAKGVPVYINGVSGDVPTIALADSDTINMPCVGLTESAANNNAEVYIVSFGNLTGLNTAALGTDIVGDTVYISTTAGALTLTPPAGSSSKLQNIGQVIREHATDGIIKVGGAGRTAATPNLDQGKIFIGNASNQSSSSVYTLPIADGSSGQVLTTDGSGAVTFQDASGGGGSSAADDITAGDAAVNITTTSGNITIDAQANDSDIIFKGTDNNSDITMLTLDGSDSGTAIFNNNLKLKSDYSVLYFGSDDDVLVQHDPDDGLKFQVSYSNESIRDPRFTFQTTSGNNSVGPYLTFMHSGSDSNNDTIGNLEFRAATTTSNILSGTTDYALIKAKILDRTNATRSAEVSIATQSNGTSTTALQVYGNSSNTNVITKINKIVNVADHDGTTGLQLAGTLVTTTAAELNIMDGDTSATSTTLVDADRIIINDAGTMKQVALTDVMTYVNANVSGGGGFTYTAITSASSPVAGAASTHYSADTSGGAITINLPALSGVTAGTEIRVKLKTAGNTLTLDGNLSETIDGSTTYTLTVQNQAVTLVSDGSSNWEVI